MMPPPTHEPNSQEGHSRERGRPRLIDECNLEFPSIIGGETHTPFNSVCYHLGDTQESGKAPMVIRTRDWQKLGPQQNPQTKKSDHGRPDANGYGGEWFLNGFRFFSMRKMAWSGTRCRAMRALLHVLQVCRAIPGEVTSSRVAGHRGPLVPIGSTYQGK